MLLLIRSLALMKQRQVKPGRADLIAAASLAVLVALSSYRWVYGSYFTLPMLLIGTVVLAVVFVAAPAGQRAFCAVMIALSLAVGGTVNPLRRGLGSIEDNQLGQAVESCAGQGGGRWIAVSDTWMLGDFLIIYGAPTINSTNTYMNAGLWHILDPDGVYEECCNRYAHITFELTDTEQMQIELSYADQVHVVLDIDDLRRIGVEYVVSEKDLRGFSREDLALRPVFSSPDVAYTVYRLEKTKCKLWRIL